jgi:AraC-like DNA-binding protein
VLMGCFAFDTRMNNPLVACLPGVIYLQAQHVQSEPWLDTTLRMLASEGSHNHPGADTFISRLTDMIFIQIMRAYITQIQDCSEAPSWLRALADEHIGAALNLMHAKPDAPWTVASLAHAVGLSRTSFAMKFTALVAQSPMSYLTSWRMQQAVHVMESGAENTAHMARLVGYTSEAAFAKAFKREMGEAPGAFKRKVRATAPLPERKV